MSILGDIGGAFVGPALEFFGAERQQDFTRQNMEYSQGFNAAEAQKNRDYQTTMSNTAYQRATADMQAAGINPMLAAMHGGASTPPGSTGSSGALPGPKYDLGQSFNQSRSVSSAVELNTAEINRKKAEEGLLNAQEDNVRAQTTTVPVNIDRMKQEIEQSKATIENLQQQTRTGVSTAAQLEQQTQNLRAALPQIEATTKHLNAMINLVKAQTTTETERPKLTRVQADEAISRLGLNDQETQKLKQYISANLPKLEAAVKDLEVKTRQFQQPGQRNEAVAQNSLLGAWSTALRHILPIGQILGIAK